MKRIWIVATGIVMIAVASMFPGPDSEVVRVAPNGPSLFQSAGLTPAVAKELERACGDCHSNNTVWPMYSRVAPLSWLVRRDVRQGRESLNFSKWTSYGAEGQAQLLSLAAEQLRSAKMPPNRYLRLHPGAGLSGQQKSYLIAALERESVRLTRTRKPER
jgi:hypothetical protein